MKVGILTWYDVINYGSVFQAYALQEQLKTNGYEVEILRHDRVLPKYSGNELDARSLAGTMRWLRNQSPRRRANRRNNRVKEEAFLSFQHNYLNIGAHCFKTNADYVLIGSDQIFDIKGLFYPFQFGKGIPCKQVGTYAPSFGETTYDSLQISEHYTEIIDSIKKLDRVNGRDKNTTDILSYIRDEKVDEVLDPTLLYGFRKEKAVWNDRLIERNYCLVYTWGGYTTTKEFANGCVKFAKKNGLKLVSIGEIRPWCDIQAAAASPVEFFELFMHADMVLTNMFHGTCFSLLMERPFYSFLMPHNINKLGGLLNYMGLGSQGVHTPDLSGYEIPKIDWKSVENTINNYRVISKKCLVLK